MLWFMLDINCTVNNTSYPLTQYMLMAPWGEVITCCNLGTVRLFRAPLTACRFLSRRFGTWLFFENIPTFFLGFQWSLPTQLKADLQIWSKFSTRSGWTPDRTMSWYLWRYWTMSGWSYGRLACSVDGERRCHPNRFEKLRHHFSVGCFTGSGRGANAFTRASADNSPASCFCFSWLFCSSTICLVSSKAEFQLSTRVATVSSWMRDGGQLTCTFVPVLFSDHGSNKTTSHTI